MATNSIGECRQIRHQLERERQREICASLTTRQIERRASLTTEQRRQRERKRQRERRASLTTVLRNMDRSSNSEQHREMRESRTSEEREQHRSTNSQKKEDNQDHNNFVSYQCIKYFTKLTKMFLHSLCRVGTCRITH